MTGESLSLFDRCCERCRHTDSEPCGDWLACRTVGPFCHTDPKCDEARTAVARRIAFGPGALVGVGQGDCGRGVGSGEVLKILGKGLPADSFEVVPTGCLGFCSAEPLVWVARPAEPVTLFGGVTPDDAVELAWRLADGVGWPEKVLAYLPPALAEERSFRDNRHLYTVEEVKGGYYPFFLDKQMRLVTAHCGLSRPTNLDDHLMRRGLHPLYVLMRHLTPEEAFAFLEDSGLESRVTGEPVAPVWQNFSGTEGGLIRLDLRDGRANPPPLTRRLLEGLPFQVLESLLLLGLVTRTDRAEIVLPDDWDGLHEATAPEDDLLRRYAPRSAAPEENLRTALEALRSRGLTGDSILGTDFSCSVELVREPSEDGEALGVDLETVLNVPAILEMGGEWFRGYGHGRHPGTKCLLVGGPLAAKGFLELNLGTPLGDVLNLVCGGGEGPVNEAALDGGGAVPAAEFDAVLDFPDPEELPGPPVLGAPATVVFRVAGETGEPGPAETGERPEVRLSPLTGLLARYGDITPPTGLPASVLLGWRMAGQRLLVLTTGADDEAELFHAGRLAGYLSREAPPEMARWAANLLNALHSQP
ncbi:MAG TPA: CCxxC motif-containing NuoF prefix domain-containing protein [bacterium]|nr:CCxxC motif-containing NuoF prefix domain-containing protein [bacterium]